MEQLRRKYLRLINAVETGFKRYLYYSIDWDSRFILIKGQRGVGKTTLILQYIKEKIKEPEKAIYISLDDIYFTKNSLSDFVEDFVLNGGEYLFVDEIHRYLTWSVELKNIYDFYPSLKIVATGSSALEIIKGEADLSRRVSLYHLHEMSLREYLLLIHQIEFPVIALNDLLSNHTKLVIDMCEKVKIIPFFKEFLKQGAYPFVNQHDKQFYDKINAIISTIIENDLPAIENITYETIIKLKRLLYIISSVVPFKPNVTDLSKKVETSRDMLLRYLYLLESAGIIMTIRKKGITSSILRKPDKIFLNNTTLMYALQEEPNIGTLRETFFLNQVKINNDVNSHSKGDFILQEKYLFEIGGKNKTYKQIAGESNAFIVQDDIEYGIGNIIPLWLFGFLY